MTVKVITGYTRREIEKKLDALSDAKPERLIMPVSGANEYDYKGYMVREWFVNGNARYDSVVEVEDEV